MGNQIHKVLILEQKKGNCQNITQALQEHQFQVQSVTNVEEAKKKLNQINQAVLVFVYLPEGSFDEWITKGKKLNENSTALVLFVLDSINSRRFEIIQKYNPYGFVTTDVDTYSLFQTLYFAIKIFEEKTSSSKLKNEVDFELNTLATTFQKKTGKDFFDSVCKHLAEALNIDFAFIGELCDNRNKVKVHSIYGEGKFHNSFEYELAETPCADVADQKLCYYECGVQELFPNDQLLQKMSINGYIGSPLFSSTGNSLGIIVLLNKKPLKEVNRYRRYLKIYSERISAEMERLSAEQELREREKELRSINEHISEGIYRSTPNEGLIYVNDAFVSMFGYENPEELLKVEGPELYANKGRRREITEIEDRQGFIKNEEVKFLRKDGSTFWALMSGKVVNDENGNIQYYDGSILDITERKEAEDLLKESLKEKEVLLLEIHHRVKNNLAIISGLLELEGMNHSSNKLIKNILHESQLRIQSMAMIHEKLYKARNFAKLKLEDYITELVEIIHDTFLKEGKEIDIDIRNSTEVELNINQAIPCALILNELVTNAFKYAFDGTEYGKLTVQLTAENDTVFLVVQDNGCGLPEDFDIQTPNSLGLKLVSQLTKQLEGELQIQNEGGARFEIEFEKKDHAGSSSSNYIIDDRQKLSGEH